MFSLKSFFSTLSLLSALFFIMTFSVLAQAAEPESLKSDMVNPGYHEKPSWFKESFLDLREDIQEATENKKRILLYFYQDGCPYCAKLLQDNFGQKKIADNTQKHFDVIAINMWGDKEVTDLKGQLTTEKTFAGKMKVMYTPTLVFLTEKGKVALRANGYYAPHKFNAALDYVSGHNEKKISFRDYYRNKMPKKLAGKLHSQPFILKPPYDLKKLINGRKPLLVLFEQKQCEQCDELHKDIFKRKGILEQVKRFNVVRIDMWSKDKLVNHKGKTVSAKTLAKQLKILHSPSLVFFDGSDKDVFRTEAYLKTFHTQYVMDYIASGAYKKQPNLQRFLSAKAAELEAKGIHVDLMH